MHPDAVINACNADGSCSNEPADISPEARDEEFQRRMECIAMILESGEDAVELDTINGPWTLDINALDVEKKGAPLEDKVMTVLEDVTEYLWFSEDQFCEELPLPESLAAAFAYVDDNLSDEVKDIFMAQRADDFAADQHFGLGLYLRNVWFNHLSAEAVSPLLLEDRMPAMLRELKSRGDYFLLSPDNISEAFLLEYHKHLFEN